MSLTQKQKDTIREEWYKHNLSHQTQTADNFKDYVADWWLKKLDQAYQQGVKDKVEEVEKALSKSCLSSWLLSHSNYLTVEDAERFADSKEEQILKLIKR
jgi:hypothetical protein